MVTVTVKPTWLTNISAIADIGMVRVSDNAAAKEDVKKQPLTSANKHQYTHYFSMFCSS